MAWRLARYGDVRGAIHCISGIRIGAGKDAIEIGGLDSPVIRHPLTRQPYIPGSSIKGKLRSLLEYCYGKESDQDPGEPCNCKLADCPVCTLFGPHKQPRHDLGPSRVIVRDAPLTAESERSLRTMLEGGFDYTEIKTETMVNRRTQVTADRTLRTGERVPADAVFAMTLSVRLFTTDDETRLLHWLGEALALLPHDTLGGSGTRGYGQVEIRDLTLDGRPWALPEVRCGGRT